MSNAENSVKRVPHKLDPLQSATIVAMCKAELARRQQSEVELIGVARILRNDGEYLQFLMPLGNLAYWRVCDLPVRDERTDKSE